ncbi:alpha/beta-hydrolase [Martensiomyces pterosporus]|nr:alpha/beta-hydrolase [Martensiomyces pterosporus]
MAHIAAAKKCLIGYYLNGPTVPSWGVRLELDCAMKRFYYENATNLALTDASGNLDIGRTHKISSAHNTGVSPIPKELGKYKRAETPVSSVHIEASDFQGMGVAEQPLADLVNADIGSGRTIPMEVVTAWMAAEALRQDKDSAALFKPEPVHNGEKVVLYFHGGAYVIGSPRSCRAEVAEISKYSKLRAISIQYRLAPKHPFPAQLHDAYIAFLYLLQAGFKPENIVLSGDSAGGHLAVTLCLLLRHIGRTPRVRALVLLAPWINVRPSRELTKVFRRNDYVVAFPLAMPINMTRLFYKPGQPLTDKYYEELSDPFVSPNFADFADFPPMLIQSGDQDSFHEENRQFYLDIKDKSPRIEFEKFKDMTHGFHQFKYLRERLQAFESIGRFVNSL